MFCQKYLNCVRARVRPPECNSNPDRETTLIISNVWSERAKPKEAADCCNFCCILDKLEGFPVHLAHTQNVSKYTQSYGYGQSGSR